jgi:Zn-dependent protease with chaperone function
MDRELVLAILVALLCGSALTVAGWCPTGSPVAPSGRVLERRAWRRIWRPFVPAVLLFAALCGWGLVEPEQAERVPNYLLLGALPFGVVLVRAAWRALRSVTSVQPDLAIATVGLLRPRILLSPRIAAALDRPALAAAVEHERAHVRHWDPLRLWLAQLGSDLLWPWPTASARFLCWRQALELARDEEARLNGSAGPDLAAAILAALRLGRDGRSLSVATLGGDASFVGERIARLMQPLDTGAPRTKRRAVWLLAMAAGVVLAVLLGTEFGECVVRTLLAVV